MSQSVFTRGQNRNCNDEFVIAIFELFECTHEREREDFSEFAV